MERNECVALDALFIMVLGKRQEARALNGRCIFMDWTLYLAGLVLASCAHDRTGLTYNECMMM